MELRVNPKNSQSMGMCIFNFQPIADGLRLLPDHSSSTPECPAEVALRKVGDQSQVSYLLILGNTSPVGFWILSPVSTPILCTLCTTSSSPSQDAALDQAIIERLATGFITMASIVRPSLLRQTALASRWAAAPSIMRPSVMGVAAFHNSTRRAAIIPPGPREYL